MHDFFKKPFNWFMITAGILIVGMTAFVVFQPVTVVPRIAYGPEYELIDQDGSLFTEQSLAGSITLIGFGYSNDQTGTIEQTIEDMRRYESIVRSQGELDLHLVLIMFDARNDTPERVRSFAQEHSLDPALWTLVTGSEEALKRTIGQGFGVYYESVPLQDLIEAPVDAPDDAVGYLQAQRYFLVDGENFIRAEYRPPLETDILVRDIQLIIREESSEGAARVVNEAAHLFLCYPS